MQSAEVKPLGYEQSTLAWLPTSVNFDSYFQF